MKKFLLFSFLLLIGACSSTVWGDSFTDAYGNTWTYTGGCINSCTIDDTVKHLIFPARLGENDVITISASIFRNNTNIVSVDMSATKIGIPSGYIFQNCTSLETVKFPRTLRYISEGMFMGCTNLKTINCSDLTNLQQIQKSAFKLCTSLEHFTIVSDQLSTIGQEAFRECSSLLNVEMQGVTSPAPLKLVQYAFYICPKLQSIFLPSVYEVGKYSFQDCIDFDPNNNTFSNVETIGDYSFQGCFSLTKMILPKVQTIGQQAFVNCSGLKVVDLSGAPITTIVYRAFGSCSAMDTIILSKSVKNIDSQAFRINVNVKCLRFMSDSLPTIAADAFSGTTIQKYKVPCNRFDYYTSNYSLCNINNTIEYCSDTALTISNDTTLNHFIEYDTVSIKRLNYTYPTITLNNYSLSANELSIDWTFDARNFYYFTLPFDCDIEHITLDNKTIQEKYITDWAAALTSSVYDDGGWQILRYDNTYYIGNHASSRTYPVVQQNETLKAGVGYVFGLLDPIEYIPNFSVKVTFKKADGYKFSKDGQIVAPSVPTPSETTEDANWNLYGNPFYWNIPVSNISFGDQTANAVNVITADESGNTRVYVATYSSPLKPDDVFFCQVPDNNNITISANPAPAVSNAPARYSNQRPLRLTLSHNNKKDDHMFISSDIEASDRYVIGEDCGKMKNAGMNQIYTLIDDTIETAFNCLNLEENVRAIPVGLTIENAGSFEIAIDGGTDFMPGTVLKLRDTQTGTEYNLLNGPATLTLGKGITDGRYVIDVKYIPNDIETVSEDNSFSAFIRDGRLVVEGIVTDDVIRVYDAAGRMVTSFTANSDAESLNLNARGVYFINVNGETIKVIY